MIAVIDYGVGNFSSVRNMLKVAGFDCILTSRREEILAAEKIILPGIGAFDSAMQLLGDSGLINPIIEKAEQGTPFLGICLGAQLLTRRSEEGKLPGLGLLEAECRKFEPSVIVPLKVPHMEWEEIEVIRKHPIVDFDNFIDRPRFYFAHSFYLQATDSSLILATSSHGHSFHCLLGSANIVAAQFHPEKSHKFGSQFLSNFARWRYEKS